MLNSVNNDCSELWVENGILYSKFSKSLELDLDKIKDLIKLREELSNGENQFWMYDISNLKAVSKEARDYADKYGQNYLNAVAVIVNSHITKFIFSVYIKLKKPLLPCAVFKDKEKALAWLLELKEKEYEINNL